MATTTEIQASVLHAAKDLRVVSTYLPILLLLILLVL
jgi:hypothetical protein